ncbi:MAG: ABC transporter permease [Chloroflexi bacterium]|nr:ABC transporter permease [Chloroflexota bacterium]
MARFVGRKLLLIAILLPLLNWVGFQYAVAHPRFNPYVGGSVLKLWQNQGLAFPSYADYLRGLARGDLGELSNAPIREVLREPAKNSMILVGAALLVSSVVGLGLGMLSVSRRTMRIKPWALLLYSGGLSLPGFLVGVAAIGGLIYLTLLRGSSARILPLSGYGIDEHLVLPVLVLASRPALQIAHLVASLVESELQQEYVRVARSKGLSWGRLLWRHALPNVASAVAIAIGHASRIFVSGLIIVETLFLWPGLGRLFMYDIGVRADGRAPSALYAHPELLAALAVAFGAVLLLTDLVASVLAFWLDPRQRHPNGAQLTIH